MALWCGRQGYDYSGFSTDGLQGQFGFTTARRNAENALKEAESVLVIWTLADLSRDLTTLVKNLIELVEKGVHVHAAATVIRFTPGDEGRPEMKVIRALGEAHIRYVSENRKIGVASAKAAGAQIGRPTIFTLDACRKTVERLRDTKTGDLPTIRKLAEALDCGKTTADRVLKEYRAEVAASEDEEGVGVEDE